MSDEAAKPILEIEIDDSRFQKFLEDWDSYQTELGEQDKRWESSIKAMEVMHQAFDSGTAAMEELADAISDSRLAESLNKIALLSERNEHAWSKAAKEAKETGKFWSNIAGIAAGVGTRGISLLNGLAGFGGMAFTATAGAAADLSNQNLQARELNLQPGEEAAFDSDFKRFGLTAADISKVSDAQGDISQWRPFIEEGFTQQQIQGMAPTELLAEFDKRASAQYRQWESAGLPANTLARSYGFDSILNSSQLRAGATYQDRDFDDALSRFQTDRQSMGVSQQTLDAATDAWNTLTNSLVEDKNRLEEAISPVFPLFSKLAQETTDMVTAFAGSEDLQSEVASISQAFTEVSKAASWVADKLDSIFGHVADGGKDAPDIHTAKDSLASWMYDFVRHPIDTIKYGLASPNNKADAYDFNWWWNRGGGTASPAQVTKDSQAFPFRADPLKGVHEAQLEQEYHLPKGLLNQVEQIESHGGDPSQLVGKDGKYLGPFQFNRDTAARFGVDVHSEYSSERGAALMYRELLRKYNDNVAEAVAAFDGFTGLDAAITKYGQNGWLSHAPKETQNYVARVEAGLNTKQITQAISDVPRAYAVQQSMPNQGYGFTMPTTPKPLITGGAQAPSVAVTLRNQTGASAIVSTSAAGM